jgi:YbbR domain-containing protein
MKHLLFHNIGWKLFSLAIAIALWVTFAGSPGMVMSVAAPVAYQNMPSDLEISSGMPEKVYLEVQGTSPRLRSLDTSAISVILNLDQVRRPGVQTFTIDRSDTNLPPGLRLVRAMPGQLQMQFERRRYADVPVSIRFAGPPPAGYTVEWAAAVPDKLKIVGPASRVESVRYAETDPVDLTNVIGQAEFRIHAFVGDPQVRLVSSPEVTVKVRLAKAAVQEGAQPGGKTTVRN